MIYYISMQVADIFYHVYNRGAHKEYIFRDNADFERFCGLLFMANSNDRLPVGWSGRSLYDYLDRKKIVNITAYCLMPNHFHICLKGESSESIFRFVQRLCTAYVMYYNKKYKHSGTIFQGSYQSRIVDNQSYYQYLIQYIHLNPYGLEEPDLDRWAKMALLAEAERVSKRYEFSSYKDYLGVKRWQNLILGDMRGLTSRSDLDGK